MTEIKTENIPNRINQGDIIKDVEYLEYVREKDDNIEVSKIIFPYIIVLTQDCDLAQDNRNKIPNNETSQTDKSLLSVLVAPIYNVEHVYEGSQLSLLDWSMTSVPRNGNTGKFLRDNKRPRYHYLEFPQTIDIVPSVIDFKHYFSVNFNYLLEQKSYKYVCTISHLYRENISHRFAFFLSRIGLPDLVSH